MTTTQPHPDSPQYSNSGSEVLPTLWILEKFLEEATVVVPGRRTVRRDFRNAFEYWLVWRSLNVDRDFTFFSGSAYRVQHVAAAAHTLGERFSEYRAVEGTSSRGIGAYRCLLLAAPLVPKETVTRDLLARAGRMGRGAMHPAQRERLLALLPTLETPVLAAPGTTPAAVPGASLAAGEAVPDPWEQVPGESNEEWTERLKGLALGLMETPQPD